jgi:type IV pilus assembly protein PilW
MLMPAASRRRTGGFSLVELLVGVVIALIAVLVIYQVFTTSEQVKRNITAVSDAQQNGLMSSFFLGIELGNAGNGIAVAAQDLATCAPVASTGGALANVTADLARTLRPIPVMIWDSGASDQPDAFFAIYSTSSVLVVPALFVAAAAPNVDFRVQSVGGFKAGDRVVAISTTGICEAATALTVSVPDASGIVTIGHSATVNAFTASALLFNLGQATTTQRVRYDVANGTLRSTDLLTANAVPNPLASNIVNLKFQYGLDTNGDGLIDTWACATGNWAPANLLAAPAATLGQIKAVRVGIVVQSEQFDRDVGDFNWTLFSNSALNAIGCGNPDGHLSGTIVAQANPAGNWRFRIYETVVPLRNMIWNRGT